MITLKEKALMVNLIKGAYRRRMAWFSVLVAGNSSLTAILVWSLLSEHAYIVKILLFAATFMAWAFFFMYYTPPDNISAPRFPWSIRERQAEVLSDVIKKRGEFENLDESPGLSEFFAA